MLNSTAKLIIIMQGRSNGVHNMKLHYKTAHAAQVGKESCNLKFKLATFFFYPTYSSILVSKPHPIFLLFSLQPMQTEQWKDGGGLGMRTTLQLQLVSYSLVS